jgi:hypothetical protein
MRTVAASDKSMVYELDLPYSAVKNKSDSNYNTMFPCELRSEPR